MWFAFFGGACLGGLLYGVVCCVLWCL